MSNPWAKLQEEDRFYNWYHGYTQLKLPYDYVDYKYNEILTLDTFTSATSGVVSTQYYGEEFQSELVERIIKYRVFVYTLYLWTVPCSTYFWTPICCSTPGRRYNIHWMKAKYRQSNAISPEPITVFLKHWVKESTCITFNNLISIMLHYISTYLPCFWVIPSHPIIICTTILCTHL